MTLLKKNKYIVASLWSAGGQYVFFALNFVGQIILARILIPEDFGVIALALSIQGLLDIALSFSVPMAYIHFKETETLFSSALMFSLLNWLILVCIMVLVLYPIYIYYQSDIALFIVLLTLSKGFTSVASIYLAKLEKELNFKKTTFITGIATIIAIILSVIAALFGMGKYSLLVREIINPILVFVAVIVVLKKSTTIFNYDKDEIKKLFNYSYKMFFARSSAILYQKLPFLFIGTYFSAHTLGLISQMFYLAMLYDRILSSFTQKVAFIFYSHSKDDMKKSKKGFWYVNMFIFLLGVPVFIIFFFFPDFLLKFLWGDKWLSGAPYLKMIAFYAILYPVFENITSLFYGQAKNEVIAFLYIIGILVYFTTITIWRETLILSAGFSISMLVMVISSSFFIKRVRKW